MCIRDSIGAGIGLNDVWTIRAAAGDIVAFEDTPAHIIRLSGDLLYLVDIVQWVPFFGPRVTLLTSVAPEIDLNLTVGVVGGLDYFLSRDLIVGVDIDVGVDPGDIATLFIGGRLRLTLLLDT